MVLLGPTGAGKTVVAKRLAGPNARYMDRHSTQSALVAHVRHRAWAADLRSAPALILDGPVWLSHRPAAIRAFRELLDRRGEDGLRTFVCQDPHGGSVYPLVDGRTPGSTVLVGLRFPEGRRGRRRFALRMCAQLGLPPSAAGGLEKLQPWNYRAVVDALRVRAPR